MYATRPVTKEELSNLKAAYAGLLGHICTGYDERFRPVIESDSEVRCIQTPSVVFIRRKMPNGRNIYRYILER